MTLKNLLMLAIAFTLFSCGGPETIDTSIFKDEGYPEMPEKLNTEIKGDDGFVYKTEEFADIMILKYKVASWDKLSDNQKKLCYYLNEAGLSGRDITYDQNNKYNLRVRKALENIYENYNGDKEYKMWKNFRVYMKRIWFSSGIHHHYAYKNSTQVFLRNI